MDKNPKREQLADEPNGKFCNIFPNKPINTKFPSRRRVLPVLLRGLRQGLPQPDRPVHARSRLQQGRSRAETFVRNMRLPDVQTEAAHGSASATRAPVSGVPEDVPLSVQPDRTS